MTNTIKSSISCSFCSSTGRSGIMVGGVISILCPGFGNRELVCKKCAGRGYIIPLKELDISMIAAMSLNRVIGRDNALPWYIPEDMKFFRKMTQGHTVIMGRKTFESIGKILPNRFNIIISRTLKKLDCNPKDVIVVDSLEAALCKCKPTDKIMIIGGGEIYRQALPYANHVYLTIIDIEVDGDTTFPELNMAEWKNTSAEIMDDHDPSFSFNAYERR